ncbi:uncharacterized protein LOC123546787 [Mercenaria mercenaria]|uniref:uncharacterized protein LOC123546787 n=1 Tax=Mercenaria mercenaria TaxID=6596 RepID=UPI00234EC99C|nr:uncharacterized protein LOC123546787 [Mercenaria mercenaria]
MTAEVSVPVGIVKELEKQPGGMNSIKDDLKQNHLIDVKYKGNVLHLTGHDENILDIANEFLHAKVGRANATNKTLGGNGTIAWTYRGKPVKHIKCLFDAEYKELLTVKSIEAAEPKVDSLVISCSYADYQTVNDMLKKLDKKIKNCKQKAVKVDIKDQQLAKRFEKEQVGNDFYCCLIVDNKDKSKLQLEFYGREEKYYKEGISIWESIKHGDKKKPASSSTSTRNLKGNESMKDSSILEEQKTTGQQKFTNSYQTTATASLLEKHATNTKTSETDETAPVSVQKTMDVDWDETANATGSSSTDSTNLSKPQMNVISTASASGGPEENIYSRAATTEVKKTPGRTIGSGETAKYSFQIENMLVYVYKESITEIKGMDAITNAANERLMHGGGVAYFISKAAGKKMDQDCYSYIARQGPLQVTRNYVSIPGDIKCKGIIHAVGPTWYDYTDKRENCARDLYETIKNILITANNKKWQKVALSAISSGLFGVPKKLCAEMYIKAFADYATEADGTLKEVHFIDVNREILDTVIETHKTWMKDASKLDFKNALEYTSAVSKTQTRKGVGSEEQDCLIQFLEPDQTSYGETRYKYRVCKKLAVFVYKGSLTRLRGVDAIALTISPDPYQIGILEGAVQNLAGHKYAREVDKYRYLIECILLSRYFINVVKKILTFNCLPVLITGAAYSKADVRTLCYNVIQTLVSVCSDTSKTLEVKELHLVNLDRDVSLCLQDQFTRLIKGTNETEKKTYAQTTYYSSNTPRSNNIDHHWMQHTPLEAIEHAKAKPSSDGTDKCKVSQEDAPKTIEKAPANRQCVYCDKTAEIKLKECSHMYCPACAVPVKTNAVCLKCSRSSEETTDKSTNTAENCPICLEPLKKAAVLPCSHKLCHECYETVKKQKPQCPICQHIFGEVTGSQPDGRMFYRYVTWKSLPGYDGCGTIEIFYIIPPGKQGVPPARIQIITEGNDEFGYPDPAYLSRVREELAAKGVTE